ncbi:MAG: class I SAM-dependent methyltransferase [Nitrososphaeria archaeon]
MGSGSERKDRVNMMKHDFYDFLAELEFKKCRSTWVGNRGKILYVFKKSLRWLGKHAVILEIGVGEGYLLRLARARGFKVYGIDISSYIVDTLGPRIGKYGITLMRGDIAAMNVRNFQGMFDAVFALDVLEHIPNLEQALLNIQVLLKNGGLLIATIPVNENPFESSVKCPKCEHIFHPFGHLHFFKNLNDVKFFLEPYYKIIEYGVVPPSTVLGRASLLKRRLFNILRIEKTRNIETLYLIAKTRG